MVFTRLGDSLATSGRHALLISNTDPQQRHRLIALMEAGQQQNIQACPADEVDNIPCEGPRRNSQLSREMNYYRERHCPLPEDTPLCLISPPEGYKTPVQWPESLHKIWHNNMPHDKIADRKGHQGWMKREGEYFIFPGGGTMFPDGAIQYIKKLGQYIPITGGSLRTTLDMGCGVASFGGYMLSQDILTMSFAPRDSHKAQIQFALERGLPAFVAMLETRRLPFPAFSFDLVHCSRCLIPFTAYSVNLSRYILVLTILSMFPALKSLMSFPGSDKSRCNLVDLMVEMDRILRPKGTVVVRVSHEVIDRVSRVARAVRWTVNIHENEPQSQAREKILIATKSFTRSCSEDFLHLVLLYLLKNDRIELEECEVVKRVVSCVVFYTIIQKLSS